MKAPAAPLLALVLVVLSAVQASPIQKVVDLLSKLEATITAEDEEAKESYQKFETWCKEKTTHLAISIKSGKAQVDDLQAQIEKATAATTALTSKISDLSASISSSDADLKAAQEMRAKQEADFATEEKELLGVIDMLDRAISVITKEMNGGAAMLQLKSAQSVEQALAVLVQASTLNSLDARKLTALVQSSQAAGNTDEEGDSEDAEDDADLDAAPQAAAYTSQSGGIVDTLEGLLDKAEKQLGAARKSESENLANSQLVVAGLNDEIRYANEDMTAAREELAANKERAASARGDLAITSKDLKMDKEAKAGVQLDCVSKAEDYEAEEKSRREEMKAVGTAKKIIVESTSGAAALQYSPVSLLQVRTARSTSAERPANFEVVHFVRSLAQRQHSPALAQLASRVASVVHMSRTGNGDPFEKVKDLIGNMIGKLEAEAAEEADQKAYCDKELAASKSKKADLNDRSDRLQVKIDQAKAGSGKLKEEVAALEKELAELQRSSAEAAQIRMEEQSLFKKTSSELSAALKGVQMALKVLKEYYAQADKASTSGAAGGIIEFLKVIESDFSKSLAEGKAEEEQAQKEFETEKKSAALQATSKKQDAVHKTQEAAKLDKALADFTLDLDSISEELDTVLKYSDSLKEQCVAKVEPYKQRVERRNAEIEGLKQGLDILADEAVLLQRSSSHSRRTLRGSLRRTSSHRL